MDEAELNALKAAVFGRGAAALPAAERAALERKLARALADRSAAPGRSGRAEAAGARPGETVPVHGAEPEQTHGAEPRPAPVAGSESAQANGAQLASVAEPERLAGSESEPEQEPDQPPLRARRLLSRPVLLTAGAALVVIIIGIGAVQFAGQRRDSLAVFDAPPSAADTATVPWFGPDDDTEYRLLGEVEGYRLHGALRRFHVDGFRVIVNEAEAAPGTEPSDAIFLQPADADDTPFTVVAQEVCLVATHADSSWAGTCVPIEEFEQQGITLDVYGPPRQTRFGWGPQGPVRVEERPVPEL